MNKYRFLLIITIGLLVSNGILFIRVIKEENKRGGPKEIIIDKLHFDQAQINSYEVYIQQHRKDIDNNEATMCRFRSSLFEQLKYPQDSSKIDSLISVIAHQQYIIEKINYNHFLAIKKLCKSTQQEDFNELVSEIPHLFSSKKRK